MSKPKQVEWLIFQIALQHTWQMKKVQSQQHLKQSDKLSSVFLPLLHGKHLLWPTPATIAMIRTYNWKTHTPKDGNCLLIGGSTSMHHHHHITLSPGLEKRSLRNWSPAARRGQKLQSQPHPLYLSETRLSQHLETQDKLNQSIIFLIFQKLWLRLLWYWWWQNILQNPCSTVTWKNSNQAVNPSFHQTILKSQTNWNIQSKLKICRVDTHHWKLDLTWNARSPQQSPKHRPRDLTLPQIADLLRTKQGQHTNHNCFFTKASSQLPT